MSTGGKAPGGITTSWWACRSSCGGTTGRRRWSSSSSTPWASWLLDRTLRRDPEPEERVLFAVLYWLNPWRLYFSGFLWNPNYLFLFGAVHLWSCLGQRERPRFWLSFLHAAGMVLAFQIHASFLLLAVASALLWWRRYFKVHWPAPSRAPSLGGLTLVPWYLAVRADPTLVTSASKGFLGRGLLYVFPLLRGLVYWLRYSSL